MTTLIPSMNTSIETPSRSTWTIVPIPVGATSSTGQAPSAVIQAQPPCRTDGDNWFDFGAAIVGLGTFIIRTFPFTAGTNCSIYNAAFSVVLIP